MIADELGVGLTITDMPFHTLITACNASTFDMIAAAMTYTESRAEILAPSLTYLTISNVVIVEASSPHTTIPNLNDLATKNVGVQSGSPLQAELEAIPGIIVTLFDNASSLIQDLVSGTGVEAAYVLEPVFTAWNQTEDLRIIYGTPSDPLALWCKYGEPELLYVINKVIFESYQNGTIYKLIKTWFE
jgi:ABC-type amino acid transport substrate-binding protein